MIVKSYLSSFPDILDYFKKYAPNCVDSISSIPIIKVSQDLWSKFSFKGYGYLVRKDAIMSNFTFLETYSKSQKLYNSLPSAEHKRDVNVYRILKQLDFPEIFVLVIDDPNAKFFILHEFSHMCGIDESFTYDMEFDDEYLDTREEQSAYYSEMRYAKQNNMTFDEYFKAAHPNEYQILEGGKIKNPELYNLAALDKSDYKRIWDKV
jgi:hypothetical protein